MDRSHSFPQKDAGEVRNLEMSKNCAPQKGKVTCWIREEEGRAASLDPYLPKEDNFLCYNLPSNF